MIMIIAGVLAALAGCGSVAVGAQGQATGPETAVTAVGQRPTPDPSTTTSATNSTNSATNGDVTVTVADNGKTVHLHIGQRLRVVLGGGAPWYRPASSGPSLRLVTASGGYSSGHPAIAVFLAVRAGAVLVTSVAVLRCPHAQLRCMMVAARGWRVHVLVAGPA